MSVAWDDDELRIEWEFEISGITIESKEVWKKKRKGMAIEYEFSSPLGSSEHRLYYVRPE